MEKFKIKTSSIEDLKNRFKQFAIENAILTTELPGNPINKNYNNQLIRCSSSSYINYRATCRAKSSADFINKLKIVEEETDESMGFLDLLLFFNPQFKIKISKLLSEGNELLSIIVSSIKTARANLNKNYHGRSN